MPKGLTRMQVRERREALEERLRLLIRQATAGGHADTSPAACRARRERCRESPEAFLRTYLPHYCVDDPAPYHCRINEICGHAEELVLVVVFRGGAKTSLALTLDLLMDACYGREQFAVIASETEDQAAEKLTNVRLELEENELLRADFGELRGAPWTATDMTTATGLRIKCRGVGQRVRGLLHRGQRPRKLIADDIDGDQGAIGRGSQKAVEWLLKAAIPGLAPRGWRARVLGNVFHRNCAVNRLRQAARDDGRPRYRSLIINALDAQDRPAWPSRFPLARLQAIRDTIGAVAFNAEFLNRPTSPGGLFQEEWFAGCIYRREELDTSRLLIALAVDPALGTEASDYSAALLVGLDRAVGHYYVLGCYIRRARPRLTLQVAAELAAPYNLTGVGVESVAFQSLLADDMARLMPQLPVIRIEAKGISKESRISRLSLPIELGQIRFDRAVGDTPLLIDQLIYYGSHGVHDDGPDALEMALDVLRRSLRGVGRIEHVAKRESARALEGWV